MMRALLLAGLVAAAAPLAANAADARHPVVVELFQAQGCSSCPPANANLMAVAERPDVLALAFQVTYWDDLGWKDTFAKRQFTERQWDYARAMKRGQVFTPQVVVNGRKDGVGASPVEFRDLVRAGDRGDAGPEVAIAGGEARIGASAAPGGAADVWLVRYDPRVLQVPIARGENRGKTLPHRNVVRELVRLGDWRGKPASFRLPASGDLAWRSAVFLQRPNGGPILAAAKG